MKYLNAKRSTAVIISVTPLVGIGAVVLLVDSLVQTLRICYAGRGELFVTLALIAFVVGFAGALIIVQCRYMAARIIGSHSSVVFSIVAILLLYVLYLQSDHAWTLRIIDGCPGRMCYYICLLPITLAYLLSMASHSRQMMGFVNMRARSPVRMRSLVSINAVCLVYLFVSGLQSSSRQFLQAVCGSDIMALRGVIVLKYIMVLLVISGAMALWTLAQLVIRKRRYYGLSKGEEK